MEVKLDYDGNAGGWMYSCSGVRIKSGRLNADLNEILKADMDLAEQLKAENERLNQENERQRAEMASMKKKIKLAMKRQQADLQAKIQAAEQRAVAAEGVFAAAATLHGAAVSESDPQIPVAQSPDGTDSASSISSLPSLGGSNRDVLHHPLSQEGNGNSIYSQAFVDSLVAELAGERRQRLEREDEVLKERQRLDNEEIESHKGNHIQVRLKQKPRCQLAHGCRLFSAVRKTNDTPAKQRDETRANFEEELNCVKEDAEQRLRKMTKANEKLEDQLLGAADQVADAFTRMSASHDDMQRIAKEHSEAKRAHSNLVTEHKSACQELEECRSTLVEAQQNLLDKAKEMEEMAASRKCAQEGQEAAMSQLMSRLIEMEAAGTGQQAERESNEEKVQSLLQEKDAMLKELEHRSEAICILQGELMAKKRLVLSAETDAQNMVSVNHGDETVSDMKAEYEHLLKELRSQTTGLQQEVEELHKAGQQADPLTLKELSLLREQLEESRAGQQAAENQIKRLSVACNEAENQVITITQEVADGHRILDDELKLRDEKYAELDAKLGRLQKRAKQRIQEVQKEKDEVETRLAAASAKASKALLKQAELQDELKLARHKAGEALRALDAERQQLRATNNKLMEEVEDLRHTLDAKALSLAEARRLASENGQTALELTATVKEAEDNHKSALLDVKEKHRKMEESLTVQLAHATSENSKMAETISALQAQLGVKESKLAELDAASSGEIVRLGASLEAVKGELSRLRLEHKKEQEQWQAKVEKSRWDLEEAEKVMDQQAVAATAMRSQFESELKQRHEAISITQQELVAAKSETTRVASDFCAYKVRANAVLQKKETELLAAKDSAFAAAQEIALKNAEQEAIVAAMERDEALKALHDSVAEYEDKLAVRNTSVLDAEHRIRDLAIKLEASKGQLRAKQEEWQNQVDTIEATWRSKCDSLEAKIKGSVEADLKKERSVLRTEHNNIKVEFQTFRDLVDTLIEEKDKEIARLLEDNAAFQRPVVSQSQVGDNVQSIQAHYSPDLDSEVAEVAEKQILILARQQAQREEEVSQCRRHIQALQEEITDLENENRLHSQQEALLKEEFRNLERAHKRDGVDMTYLKNVILKLLQTGEVEALLPVVAMLLQFSPDELKRCHDTYNNPTASNIPLSGAAPVVDSAVIAPSSFFSNFKFAGGN